VHRREKDVANALESETYSLAACCNLVMCDVAAIIGTWRCGGVRNLRNLRPGVTVNENVRRFR